MFFLCRTKKEPKKSVCFFGGGAKPRPPGTHRNCEKGDQEMDIRQLRRRAQRHGLILRSDRHGGYMLVDPYTNGLTAPGPMSLEQVGLWLDDMES